MKTKRTICLIMAVLCIATLAACSSSNNKVIAKVNKRKITLKDFTEGLDYMLYVYGIDTSGDIDTTTRSNIDLIAERHFKSIVLTEVVMEKGDELGFFELSEEEEAKLGEQLNEEMDYIKSTLKSQIVSENPDLTEKELEMKLDQEMRAQGYTEDSIRQLLIENIVYDKVYEHFTANLEISDEELQEEYNAQVESAKATYTQTPSNFEEAVMAGTQTIYTPANARRVKHILISFDDATYSELYTLLQSGSEEEYNRRLKEELAVIEEKATGILERVTTGGEDFDTVMQEASDDPGLETMPNGYTVVQKDSLFDKEFVEGAFALENTGDISGLVSTINGYHIIKVEEILEEGPTPLEEVREAMLSDMLSEKQTTTFYNLAEEWRDEMSVTTYESRYKSYVDKTYGKLEVSAAPSDGDDEEK